VPDLEMDQSKRSHRGFRPRRSAGALRLRACVASLAVAALAIGGSACGSGGGEAGASSAAPQPRAEAPIHVGGSPVAVAVADRGVWIADNSGSRVIELDPMGGRPVGRPIPVAPGPQAIAVGEGGVWVTSGDGTITRIYPDTGKAQRAPDKVADPAGIAAGESAVWITSRTDGTVTRIDPETLEAVGDPIPVGSGPTDVAVGAGAAWVTNTDDGTVTRIEASSGEPGEPIAVADYQVLALAYGEDGVWVARTDDRLARTIEVVRIDPETSQLDDEAAPVPAAIPVRLAAGEGGVWVTLVGGVRLPESMPRPGQVALLDPADLGNPPQVLRAGDRPAGIAVGAGAVWVANSASGSVTRIGVEGPS
jgi:outer membrane protein assembly factor BamB